MKDQWENFTFYRISSISNFVSLVLVVLVKHKEEEAEEEFSLVCGLNQQQQYI